MICCFCKFAHFSTFFFTSAVLDWVVPCVHETGATSISEVTSELP